MVKHHGKFGMTNEFNKLRKFWKNKKVFLTGHTGFKGAWFTIFLNLLGAKVIGYSLKPEKNSFYNYAKINKFCEKIFYGDICNYKNLKKKILSTSPDILVHMAAQPLVRYSYDNPRYTYEVNTMGTINILSILNEINFVKTALFITTDKVYYNNNKKKFYVENDILGGKDPYSNSKALAELSIKSYYDSFLKEKKIYLAAARAGNVIGGGDFSEDRIVPDYFRSFKKKKLYLRQPNSIRPWQHIIEPLYGYLILLEKLYKKKNYKQKSWNFGPKKSNNKSVIKVINLLNKNFNNKIKIIKKLNKNKNYRESQVLMLNSTKAKKELKWKPKYNLSYSLKLVADWHRAHQSNSNLVEISQNQILNYFKKT